jgi:histidine phosphotransferase ChpT
MDMPAERKLDPTESTPLRLAELLCARLCHDFSGPLGALMGLLEIAREEQPGKETLAVAEATAIELARRLKLLRAAWGRDGNDLDVARLQSFADTLSASRHLQLDLGGLQPETVFSPASAQLILNILLLAAESLPGGGVLALSGSAATNILATIAGPRAAWPRGFAACLTGDAATWSALDQARSLQGPLTALIARSHGFHLSLLMPAGPTQDPDAPPPLLISLQPH